MKRSHLLWLSGAVVAGCSFLVYEIAVESRTSGPAPESTAAHAAPVASTADVARMNAQVAALRAQVAGLQRQVEAPAEPAADAPPPLSREEQVAEDQRKFAAYAAGIEADFHREPVDAAWASKTSDRVRSAINGIDVIRAATRDIQCRSRMCRIEVADDGTGALHKALPLLATQFTDQLPRMVGQVLQGQDGSAGMALYLMGPDTTTPSSPKN